MEGNTRCEEEPNNGSEPSSEDIDEFIKTQKIDAKTSDSQDTYCEVMSERIEGLEDDVPKDQCSQSIFSQETEYELPNNDDINTNITPTDSLPKSSEVEVVMKLQPMVVLDSTESIEQNSAITIDDSDTNKPERSQTTRRKSTEISPVPSKRTCPTNEFHSVESSTSLDFSPVVSIAQESSLAVTPSSDRNVPSPTLVKSPIFPVRSSPRKQLKRSNSCDACCQLPVLQPTRRLMRSLSSDSDRGQENLSQYNFKRLDKITESTGTSELAKDSQKYLSSPVGDLKTHSKVEKFDIAQESQSFDTSNSQNIKLFLSPSTFDLTDSMKDGDTQHSEPIFPKNGHGFDVLESHHSNGNDVAHLSESHHNTGDFSSGEIQKSSPSGGHTDLDSTTSMEMDSPYQNEPPNKLNAVSKPYLSNGYSSSTPENAPFTEGFLLKKTFHVSDSEGDNTPTFVDYNKQTDGLSKLSNNSKSDTSSARNSFLNNGHSNGSHFSNSSNPNAVPSFNIQMCSDENNEFLSMFIVKTDHDLGNQTLKEYQRVTRRLTTVDSYAGDVSKTTSPSSVTSGGLLHLPPHPRSSFMSATSSASSSSSSRTSDGAFIIPQRPRKTLSFQTQPCNVKGWQGLKQKMAEFLQSLSEVYGLEDSTQSPMNDLSNTSRENDKPPKSPSRKLDSNDCNRTTPKSSKKKIQTKTKRVLSGKIKKSDLTVTNEEEPQELEGIHSPEMIPTDPDKCQQSHTPFRNEKHSFLEDNRNSPKTTSRIRKLKSASPAVYATCTIDNGSSAAPSDEGSYPDGTLVLAKWVDKRYYSGKVKQVLDFNKYLIQFDDGHSKPLLDDFIIFGNMTELPLVGQSIYAMVDDEQTYEPSLVLGIEKSECGSICYKCTTDRNSMVSVVASEIYLTEDQAKSFKESNPPKSPQSIPGTPRRRTIVNRELDLDNIIQGPRGTRQRDKGTTTKGVPNSPSSPKASTSSGGRGRGVRRMGAAPKCRQESESSEGGDSRASSGALEEVGGVQPEVQKTPRKITGVRAHDLPIKGASKQMIGKKCSKVTKFENDDDTVSRLGPIPPDGSTFFSGLHFLLTCTELPRSRDNKRSPSRNYSDSEQNTQSSTSTEKDEDNMLATNPFQKERLKEQLEKAGGTVYSHFEDIPKSKYSVCKLIVPRPCLTAKYIQCLGANIRALSYFWVIRSCLSNKLMDQNEYSLPTGWSLEKNRFIRWKVSSWERGSSTPFKDKLILLCSDNDNFTKFWERVCSLAGANTRVLTEENNLELGSGIVIVTECDCPHEVQNKANLEGVPLVSTSWVVQCLIDGKLLGFNASPKYNFEYNDAD